MARIALIRDVADAATGQPMEISPRKRESSCRTFPILISMQEQEGRGWFTIERRSLTSKACSTAGQQECGASAVREIDLLVAAEN